MGDLINFYCHIPPTRTRALYSIDAYLVVVSPSGYVYSILSGSYVKAGLWTYYRGSFPDGYDGIAYTHIVCPGAEKGIWTTALVEMPLGVPPNLALAYDYDIKKLTLVKNPESNLDY